MNNKELEFNLELYTLNPAKQWKAYSEDGEYWSLGADGIRGMFLLNKSKEQIIEYVRNFKNE